jgi:ParB/RepB/Spo0J family partition protein
MRSQTRRKLKYVSPAEIKRDPRNPRKHSQAQIQAIASSMRAFGFNAPILVDKENKILAGHGRLEASISLGLEQIPVICLNDLTREQARAYMLADNKLTD